VVLDVRTRLVFDQDNLEAVIGEGLKKDITSRTARVRSAARAHAPEGTGRLRRAIKYVVEGVRMHWVGRVYIDDREAYHGLWVHEGTGRYGPAGRDIEPQNARRLVFKNQAGRKIAVLSVRGQRGNPFLRRAMPAARD
jgi:hypothetical protein